MSTYENSGGPRVGSVHEEFEGAGLGDARLEAHLARIAASLGTHPEYGPKSMSGSAELEATYRFVNNDSIDVAQMLAPHKKRTAERAGMHEEVLVVHDTTALRYGAQDTREGLGPLTSKSGKRGLYYHASLALCLEGKSARDPGPSGAFGTPNLRTFRGAQTCRL